MTAQIPDQIRIDNDELRSLCSNPLEPWLQTQESRPNFEGRSTALWRGYIATWRIQENQLLLEALSGFATIADVFAADPDRMITPEGHVVADWYTGELRIPEGKQVAYVHMGYGSQYERDRVVVVLDGQVMLTELVAENADQLLFYSTVNDSIRNICSEDEWPFIQRILEDPIDPEFRIVFADWLEEREDPRAPLLRLIETSEERALPERERAILRYQKLSEICAGSPCPRDSIVEQVLKRLSTAARKPERMHEHVDQIRRLDDKTRTLLRCIGLLPCEHLMWSWQALTP